MKKILFFLMVLLSLNANAQYFSLTEKGLVPADDETRNFIVVEKEGKTKAELFNMIKGYIYESYVSPKDVMSENGIESITLNGVSDGDVQCKIGLAMLPFETNYTITFMFKDGRIRVNAPSINSMTGKSYTLGGQLSGLYELTLTNADMIDPKRDRIVVFKKNGKTTKGAKESIENLFNTIIDRAVNYTAQTEEEW